MSQSTLIDSSTLISKTNQTSSTSAVYNVALGTDVSFQVSGSQVTAGTAGQGYYIEFQDTEHLKK